MKKFKPEIMQTDPETPIEIIADELIAISDGIKKLRNSRLNDKAIFMLIQNAAPPAGSSKYNKTKVGINEIRAVIQGIENLKSEYLK